MTIASEISALGTNLDAAKNAVTTNKAAAKISFCSSPFSKLYSK